jgi:hypothetical protein
MTPAAPPLPFAALLAELAEQLRTRLRQPAAAVFDALDDALFELAEHAVVGERQQTYFDGMRECRRHRNACLDAFATGIHAPLDSPEAADAARRTLSLIDQEALEVDLAVAGMASRALQRMNAPTHALNQRMRAALDNPDLDDASNPFGPQALAQGFRRALAAMQFTLEVRLIALKLFERHVLGALEPIYLDINTRLADAGILPTLNLRMARESTPAAEEPRPQPAPTPPPPTTTSDAEESAPLSEFAMLASLLAALQARVPAPGSAPTAPPAQAAQAEQQSVDALGRAMARVLQRLDQGLPLPPPRQFAAQLLAEARYADDGAATTATHIASVDLVGRIFESLLGNGQLPKPLRGLFAPLQVPVSRAALSDPTALAVETGHPLRQALDLLADAAKGWCASADPGRESMRQWQGLVDAITHAASAERQLAAVQALRHAAEMHHRRAEIAEQRAVAAATGREQLASARRLVHQVISARLSRTAVPPWAHHLITRPWSNYLVLLLLRHGETSASYREGVGFADLLAWCAAAGTADVERLRLRALVPVLESQLRVGLATVAYHPTEIDHLCTQLRQFMEWRLGEIQAPEFIDREPSAALSPSALDVDAGIVEEQPLAADVDPAMLQRMRNLKPGTWFEFGAPGAHDFERAKLSWVSPSSGRCLFVNRNGMRVAERRPEDLVETLQRGLARILEDTNLMQQTLNSLLQQLHADDPASHRSGA